MLELSVLVTPLVESLRTRAQVKLPNPVVKRLLIERIAESLIYGSARCDSRDRFLAWLRTYVLHTGLPGLEDPGYTAKLVAPTNLDGLLSTATKTWNDWFGACEDNHQTIIIEFDFNHEELVAYFAYAIHKGWVAEELLDPSSATSSSILREIVLARFGLPYDTEPESNLHCLDLARPVVGRFFGFVGCEQSTFAFDIEQESLEIQSDS